MRDRMMKEPKELGEIMDLVEALTKLLVGPGTAGEKLSKATALLPDGIRAADGIQSVGAELKSAEVYQACGAFAGRIAEAIINKPEAAVVAPVQA